MFRVRHFTQKFALLACLTFLVVSSIGCSDSVVAPVSGPTGDATESNYDTSSTPDGGSVSAEYSGVDGSEYSGVDG